MKRVRSFTSELVYTGILLAAVLLIRFIAFKPAWVESGYTYGLYWRLSKLFRYLFGWIPFSFGDIVYIAAATWLIFKLYRLVRTLAKRQFNRYSFMAGGFYYFRLAIWIYLVFNFFWGLNYNRPGIAKQLSLKVQNEPVEKLRKLTTLLLDSTNFYSTDSGWKKKVKNQDFFEGAENSYQRLGFDYPFLSYKPASIKASLFGVVGNYVGYSGYYNPFTGEAQINDCVPKAVLPFVTCHEIAHQLGYAKENEANFVGFLAATHNEDSVFRYSAFFEMFLYANSELYMADIAAAKTNLRALSPEAKADLAELREFRKKYESPVDRAVSVFYDRYLKLNQQPAGERSYSRVVMWLLAYYSKAGRLG